MAGPRRLVFGEVADLYDRHRPAYPSALVGDLIEMASVGQGDKVLEVGAGTGKATVLFAARGLAVAALEPSAEMAAVARRNCAPYPETELIEADFERWEAGEETFPLLYSAQAWHWIDPELRYRRARSVLSPGGLLAVFWNRPAWGRSELRDALAVAYAGAAPELAPDGPMHPANENPDGDEDWPGEIAAADGFQRPRSRSYQWRQDYTGEQYAGLLATLSEIRLLHPEVRRALLRDVRSAIEAHGGTLRMPLVTRLHCARAA
jgi:SAM-dependent methyltransferase